MASFYFHVDSRALSTETLSTERDRRRHSSRPATQNVFLLRHSDEVGYARARRQRAWPAVTYDRARLTEAIKHGILIMDMLTVIGKVQLFYRVIGINVPVF